MEETADAGGRHAFRTWVAVAAVIVLVSLAVWIGFAAQQRAQVHVFFDAAPVECDAGDMTVEAIDIGLGEGRTQVIIDATEDVDCRLRFHVENHGRVAATLRNVVLPLHGETAGGSLQAVHLSPLGIEPLAEDEDGFPALDAVFPSDYRLEPAAGIELSLHLRFNADGCMSPGSMGTNGRGPVVDVEVLGRRGERAPVATLFTQRGTADSDCSPGG